MAISVNVQAVDANKPDYGNTTITITEDDPQREELLKAGERICRHHGRTEEAGEFTEAIPQTPST